MGWNSAIGTKMARLGRYVIPGQAQHIIQRGNNRQAIFAAEADYQFFRDALVEAAAEHGLAIHAYVWMTNHILCDASHKTCHVKHSTMQ